MQNPNPFENLVDAIRQLKAEGYTEDFDLRSDCIDCRDATLRLYPHEFDVDKVFRFFGPSDPDDESILYAISSDRFGIKGLLVNGYGASADTLTAEMIGKLG